MERKFIECSNCGIILASLGEARSVCSGADFKEMIPGTTDAAAEKHVPVYEVSEGKLSVKFGDVAHPMLPEHYIEWIAAATDKGFYVKYLSAGDAPAADFVLTEGEKVLEVYAYCNLHKLWKA